MLVGLAAFGDAPVLLGDETFAFFADVSRGLDEDLLLELNSSRIGRATDFLFNSDMVLWALAGRDLRGMAPFLIGVVGGRFLSKCSGLSCGPKDTLFFNMVDLGERSSFVRGACDFRRNSEILLHRSLLAGLHGLPIRVFLALLVGELLRPDLGEATLADVGDFATGIETRSSKV